MIGLWHDDPYWRDLLEQEGVPFVAHTAAMSSLPPVVILDSVSGDEEARLLSKYVEDGGAVLAGARCAARIWPDLRPMRAYLRYIIPDMSTVLERVGMVCIEGPGWLMRSANVGRTGSGRGAIYLGAVGRGQLAVLPFEMAETIGRIRPAVRQFYARTPRLPYEVVSLVDRGGVRRIVASVIRHLLRARGLPYVRLSMMPGKASTAFGFRVDTDGSSFEQLSETASILREAGIKATWFVQTKGLAEKLPRLVSDLLGTQDVQFHCHVHRVYHQPVPDSRNVRLGLEALGRVGTVPVGCAAPYGEWSPAFGRVLADAGMEYSSEFACGYDDVPWFPRIASERIPVLQVPVHPICLGRLVWAHADEEQMESYLLERIRTQSTRSEPCLLYDHPNTIVRYGELMRRVLTAGIASCETRLTMTEYARFWIRRSTASYQVFVRDDTLEVKVSSGEGVANLVVEKDGRQALVPLASATLSLPGLDWRPIQKPPPFDLESLAVTHGGYRARLSDYLRSTGKRVQAWFGRL